MTNQEIIKKIKNEFGNSSDIVVRELSDKISYIYLESVSSDDKVSNFLLKSIVKLDKTEDIFNSLKNMIFNSHIQELEKLDDCYYYLTSGYTCLFIEKEKKYIVIETKATLDRGVTESNSEPLIRGPKDSFTENNSTNIGLIRKRIKDTKLRIDELKIGRRTQNKVSIIYIEDIAKNNTVNSVKKTLRSIDIDGILDTGYLQDFLESKNPSTFPQMISTERPDFSCQGLLDGKVIVMVENTPYVLMLPAVLTDFFKTSEDYYQFSYSSSFNRILKVLAFFITIMAPAIYIALMSFNQEMIPNQLLISMAIQRSQIPFPTFIEVIIFIIIFEILREADIKSPSVGGASMSIVGALVLGDAAITAGLVSPIVIIVVAFTSICELTFTDTDFINALRQWRLLFIFSTVFIGIIGIIIAGLILLIKLAELELYDTPFLSPFSPLYTDSLKDSLVLFPKNKLKERPSYLTNNKTKAGNL